MFSKKSFTSSGDTDSQVDMNNGEMISAPDFKNMTYENLLEKDAEDTTYNIVAAIEGEFSDSVPQGAVLSQFPEANEKIAAGTTIIVTLSDGTKERELPDISDKKLDEAAELLAAERFITQIRTEYSDSVAAGSVIGYYQDGINNYKAGDKLPCSSWVTIVVSRGENPYY